MLVSMFLSSGLVLAGSLLDGWSAFLVTRALLGLALGGLPAIAMTYLAEEIEPAALNATMSLYIGGNALGGVLGRLMNGILADLFSWRVSLAVTAPEAKAQLASLYMFAFYAGSGLISWFGGHVWTWGQWPAVSLYLAMLAILGLSAAAALPWARRRAELSLAEGK